MIIQTSHFGEIEVDETRALEFSVGLPGFEDTRHYILLPHGENSPFYFLQSLERPEVAFVTAWPWKFFPDYAPDVPTEELRELGLEEAIREQLEILVILTIPADPRHMTANLLAPVVINLESRQARQVILAGSDYTTRHRVWPEHPQRAKSEAVAGAGV